jgi:7-dehydrocholesterol reductase
MSTSHAVAVKRERVGPRWLRQSVLPALLIVVCPPAVMLLWYTHAALGGSIAELARVFARDGFFETLSAAWGPNFFGSATAWTIIGIFAGTELALMRLLPGKPFQGPVTPEGNVPVYKANGVLAFATTLTLFAVGAFALRLFPASILYDHLGEILGAMNLFSLVFCVLLYVKGRFAPSTSDHGLSGNFVFDYYWGTELYPRVLGWDVKMFTNCRFGMMGWPLLLLSYAAKQEELYGLSDSMVVAVALQLVYVAKFFWWETGYLRSLDIMHDRAGFYLCWGCMVWVPGVYTSSTLYLVHHPNSLGIPLSVLLFMLGSASIFVNYLADRQRQRVRATGGACTVWGKPPALILARYTTEKGESKENLLLASGWWGLARHFHYLPEILGALFWTLPALFDNVLPYFYVIFLTVLLTDRSFRDDRRCAAKYGEDWDRYRAKVRYRIIPGVL